MMKFGILILEGPYQHQAGDSAYNFAEAALKKGHTICGIFFYCDGVQNATNYMTPPQDDRHISKRWSELILKYGIDSVVCIAASKKRGITEANLIKGARIAGLGQLTELGIQADRLVSFGD
jgi:tRNA 2-thiouridine synthesizing protein D